jgi:hypothetical protein
VHDFSSNDDNTRMQCAASIPSRKDFGESPSQSESNGKGFQNENQFVGVMTVSSPVQAATPELGPSSTFHSQNHHKCQQIEHCMPVPSSSKGTNYS